MATHDGWRRPAGDPPITADSFDREARQSPELCAARISLLFLVGLSALGASACMREQRYVLDPSVATLLSIRSDSNTHEVAVPACRLERGDQVMLRSNTIERFKLKASAADSDAGVLITTRVKDARLPAAIALLSIGIPSIALGAWDVGTTRESFTLGASIPALIFGVGELITGGILMWRAVSYPLQEVTTPYEGLRVLANPEDGACDAR